MARRRYVKRRRTTRGRGAYYRGRGAYHRKKRPTRRVSRAGSRLKGKGAYHSRRYSSGAGGGKEKVRKRALKRGRSVRRQKTGERIGDLLEYATGFIPGPYGSIANAAVKAGRSILGYGAYSVGSNSLMAGMTSNGVPMMHAASENGVRIKHREYLFDVGTSNNSPTIFDITALYLNPGESGTFPWLSQIAVNFEQYKIHGMVFEYKTLSVDGISSTNVALGSVILATDYNPLHVPFTSKQQMENYVYCSSGKPSVTILHPIECSPRETPIETLYVRSAPVPTGADPRLYDWGIFQIATVGLPAPAAAIGELWISYDIEFFKPNVPVAVNPDQTFQNRTYVGAVASNSAWTAFTNSPLGFAELSQIPSVTNPFPRTQLSTQTYPLINSNFVTSAIGGFPMMSDGGANGSFGYNSGDVRNGLYQKGFVGPLVTFQTATACNKLYFMADEDVATYQVTLVCATASAAAAPGVISVAGDNSYMSFPNFIQNNTVSILSAPNPAAATQIVETVFYVQMQPIGFVIGKNAAACTITYTWAGVTPLSTDITINRLS